MHTVLLVDDNEDFNRYVESMLTDEYRVLKAGCVSSAVQVLNREAVSAVITDYQMTGLSGFDLVSFAKALSPAPQIIMVSAYIDKDVALRCANSGIFGVMEKPFAPDELRFKIRSAVSRLAQASDSTRALIKFESHALEVSLQGRSTKLTSTEFAILSILYTNQGHWVSRDQLEQQVWEGRSVSRNLLDTHISNLRKKVPELKTYIQVWRDRGYQFDSPSPTPAQ